VKDDENQNQKVKKRKKKNVAKASRKKNCKKTK
jgi:hypothetical protein